MAGHETGSFSPSTTFWLFLSQVLSENGSCREIVRRFLVWLFLEKGRTASQNTAAYCKARAKLSLSGLRETNQKLQETIEDTGDWLWLGRRVKVVDGSGLSMPDTPENQGAWPQPKGSKPGCGFPVMRVVALFSLASGALIDLAHDSMVVSEKVLSLKLWFLLEKTDVLLGDRGFCGFADFFLLSQRGVDCVMRKNARRQNASVIKRIHKNDRIVEWKKSGSGPKWLDPRTWRNMPESIQVREVKIHVRFPGFRSQTILVVTTLLDDRACTTQDLSELYLRRWLVELFLRDIKTTLGMDVLRCKTPKMVEKELWMHVIAYNLIRAVMIQASLIHDAPYEQISFKGTLSTLRQWAPAISSAQLSPGDLISAYVVMLYYIARDRLPLRPGRVEPRARKRRPKTYQLLNKPRAEFKEIMHRNRYKKP